MTLYSVWDFCLGRDAEHSSRSQRVCGAMRELGAAKFPRHHWLVHHRRTDPFVYALVPHFRVHIASGFTCTTVAIWCQSFYAWRMYQLGGWRIAAAVVLFVRGLHCSNIVLAPYRTADFTRANKLRVQHRNRSA